MKILFFGDIIGKAGRRAIARVLPRLRIEYKPDLVIANAENIAHGKGFTITTLEELINAGIDFFTSGNHAFAKEKEAREVFEKHGNRIIRPANFPQNLPGKGFAVIKTIGQQEVLIINLNGRVFMETQFDFGKIENPFSAIDNILKEYDEPKIKFLDFHAEATSEKRGMGFYVDGRLSAVVGTHTHVPTADAQILPSGTGYQTDVGMVGAAKSVIGVVKDRAIKRLVSEASDGEKVSLEVDESPNYEIGYVYFQIDDLTGRCENIISKVIYEPDF